MESQRTTEILDYRNENGHGWFFYKSDGLLRTIFTTPENDMEMLRKVQKLELRDDDMMVAAYPKCGTHWLWEIVNMLRAGNTEYNKRSKEMAMLGSPKSERADELPSPRILNSHLYFRHLPEKMLEKRIKTIFIMRNPKDVSVSYYCMVNGLKSSFRFDGTYSEYLNLFLEGKVPGGVYADYVKDWLQDPVGNIKTIADFIGVSASDDLCEQIAEACSFKKMRTADSELKEHVVTSPENWKEGHKGIYRKGEVGDWKNWITVAQNERFDDVIERTFKGTGIVFAND